jgi:hypothetical protein
MSASMETQIHRLIYMAAGLAFLAGCSRGSKAPVAELDPDALPKVSCNVLLGGEDVKDVVVELREQSKDAPPAKGAPRFLSRYDDEGGCYSFYTLQGKEKKWGVPEGEYSVLVKPVPGSKTRVPAKYADPKTSQLTAEIHAGINALPPFELTP